MGAATFVLRAYRTVSGTVRAFDRDRGLYVAIAGAAVRIRDGEHRILTDANGRYLLRDVPPGEQTVTASYQGQQQAVAIHVPDEPAVLKDVDLRLTLADSIVPPAPETAAAAGSASEVRASASFVVQVAALKNARRARQLVAELLERGLPAHLVDPVAGESTPFYRVRVGPYVSRAEALSTATMLESARGERPWIAAIAGQRSCPKPCSAEQ
jgi:cell division septation protein DedD